MLGDPKYEKLLERVATLEKQLALSENFLATGFWKLLDLVYAQSDKFRKIRCIVCDFESDHHEFQTHTDQCMFGGGELKRFRCPKCDCIFGPLKYLDLDEEFVKLDYKLLYTRYSESNSTESEIACFHDLAPVKGNGKIYLDWGAGGAWSKTVQTLRDEGYDVWGFEPSISTSSEFIVGSKDEISAKFDGIFSNNVIEHFRNPVDQFLYFNSILSDGGRMVHRSPCYEYEYSYTRFHTLFLLGKSPHVLANRTGFRATQVHSSRKSISYLYEKLDD